MSYIFLSYGLENREDARLLSQLLRAKGFTVWDGEQDPEATMLRLDGVKNCQVMVVLMTPLASRSARVQREGMLAQNAGKPILPVLMKGEIFPEYRDLPYMDMRDGLSLPGAMVKMLKAIISGEAGVGEPKLPETSILGQPQALRELAKAIRSGLVNSPLRGVTQEMASVAPMDEVELE